MESLQVSFKKVLSKFKYEEFPDMLTYVFGDVLLWNRVTRKLNDLRLDKRAKTVAEVCCMLYQKTRPAKDEAVKTLWLLELYEASIHSNRNWFGIKFKEPFPDSSPSLENIGKNLSRAYRKELKTATVYETIVGNLRYIMAIEEKVTKKGSRFLPPVFFVCNTKLEQPFAFYTPKLSKTHPLDCLSSAIGYQDYRRLALSGKDVDKLFEAILRKYDGTVALRAPLLQIVPVTQEHITDMTGYSSRRKYAMKILPEVTQMKKFTVQSENEWRGTSIIPRLKTDCVIASSMTIQTKKQGCNVDDVLREMVAQGIIKTPLPSWLLKFAQQPRDTIKLCSRAAILSSSGGAFEHTNITENGDPNYDEDFSVNETGSLRQ